MNIPPKYEDVVAKLAEATDTIEYMRKERVRAEGREAALREELDTHDSASQLMNAWVAEKGQMPWVTAISIMAIATKMPDEERQRLLDMDDGSTERGALIEERKALQQRLTVAEHDAALSAARLKLEEDTVTLAIEHSCELQERVAVAWRRTGELERLLADVPQIHFEGCDFQGFNPDGSEPFEFTDGPVKKIKSIRLIGWRCDGPVMAALNPSEDGEGL